MIRTLLRSLLYAAAILSLMLCMLSAAALATSYERGYAVLFNRGWVEDMSRPGAIRPNRVIFGQGLWIRVIAARGGFFLGYSHCPGEQGGGPSALVVYDDLRFVPQAPPKYPIANGQPSFLGFAWEGAPSGQAGFGMTLPLWFLVTVTAVLPGLGLALYRRRALLRRGRDLCLECGYDLRGSPPGGACPECGAARPVTATGAEA